MTKQTTFRRPAPDRPPPRESVPAVRPSTERIAELAHAIAPHVAAILTLVMQPTEHPNDLLPLVEAARIAATSVRVVREAIRGGEIVAFGGQRDRAVRRSDLVAWIESRRVIHPPIDDADIERRIRRIAKERAKLDARTKARG